MELLKRFPMFRDMDRTSLHLSCLVPAEACQSWVLLSCLCPRSWPPLSDQSWWPPLTPPCHCSPPAQPGSISMEIWSTNIVRSLHHPTTHQRGAGPDQWYSAEELSRATLDTESEEQWAQLSGDSGLMWWPDTVLHWSEPEQHCHWSISTLIGQHHRHTWRHYLRCQTSHFLWLIILVSVKF